MLWISGVGIVSVLTGIVVGIVRWRPRKRYRNGRTSPYHGMMRWHHVLGLAAAVPLLTWIVSGWLSLNPGRWFSDRSLDRVSWERYAGLDHALASFTITPEVAWRMAPINPPANAARRLLPDARRVRVEVLQAYDFYWYAHHDPRLLPVLRVTFDDPHSTWFHIDPTTGDVLERLDTSRRVQRMLFNALHSLDFPILLAYRPAWDFVVVALSVLGLALSVTAIVVACSWLRRLWGI